MAKKIQEHWNTANDGKETSQYMFKWQKSPLGSACSKLHHAFHVVHLGANFKLCFV